MKSHYRKKFKSQTWTECTIAPCWSVILATSAKKNICRWCNLAVSYCANSFPARVCLQAHCVKTEPGEPGENKPNLRRRMGSFVAKQEPGQYWTLQLSRTTWSAKVSSLFWKPCYLYFFKMPSVSLLLQRKKFPFQLNKNQLKSRNQSLKLTSSNPGTRNSSLLFLRVQ